MPENDEEVLDEFIDDRKLQTTISDIEERVNRTFEDVSKYGPESGDLPVANYVWQTTLRPAGTITVEPEKEDCAVLMRVHLREDSAAVDVGYPIGYCGSCVYIDRRSAILDAIREVTNWEETTEISGDIPGRHLR